MIATLHAPPVPRHTVNGYVVEPTTGPFDLLHGRTVFVLADLENLHLSARDLGYHLSLSGLADALRGAARTCVLHACLSRRPEQVKGCRAWLEGKGWTAHLNTIETFRSWRGVQTRANSDNLLLCLAGKLLSRSQADCVVLGSGDGDLVQTLAHFVAHHLPKVRDVVTLSLPGSTSHRLNAAHNRLLKANLEVGRDCLRPLVAQGR